MNKQLLLEDLAKLEKNPPKKFVCGMWRDKSGCNCIYGEIMVRNGMLSFSSGLYERYSAKYMQDFFVARADKAIIDHPDSPKDAVVQFYDFIEENMPNG